VSVEPERIRDLNDAPARAEGSYVLYWMQHDVRAHHNPALEHAVRLANERDRSLLVGFGLFEDYPASSERHFAFLLEGLADADAALRERGLKLVVRRGEPDAVALGLARDAGLVVCDRGYLRHERRWRRRVAEEAGCRVVEVEGGVVVPADLASGRREYAARTLRPKLARLRDGFLRDLRPAAPAKSSLPLAVTGDVDVRRPERALASLRVDRGVPRVGWIRGGTRAARRRLTAFLRRGLPGYAARRRDPADEATSFLSPYLHFGHISPVEVARKAARAAGAGREDRDAFLEELVVRRELAVNYVLHEPDYDAYAALPDWARGTLGRHADDARPHRYTRGELEASRTHDRWWNAAMTEMRGRGWLHNAMRMYWGKKILEWAGTPEHAFRTALALNDRYLLDGRDPSSYANVAWVFGLHDRPWGERPIYGTVRTMTAKGLERKFDVAAWAEAVASRHGAQDGGR